MLADAKRIAFYGIGPTAALAQYVHFVFARNGRPGILLQASGSTLADHLLDLENANAVLMLAYGTAYPEAEATILEARRCRIPIVWISDLLDERLARRADVIVPVARGLSGNVALHRLGVHQLGMAASGGRDRSTGDLTQERGPTVK